MPRRIVTISFTGLNAGGGVPKFNRDLHAAFSDRECVHFCWEDFGAPRDASINGAPEWIKAHLLNRFLIRSKLISHDDIVVADGFWADGLELFPFAISHSHGIWGHVTRADVEDGKPPENPHHHAAQITFRRKWVQLKKPLTAVSDFIAHEMREQWGFDSTVINNGVDTELYAPMKMVDRSKFLIVHGVNDPGNANKGWEHINLLKMALDADVLSLDEAYFHFGLRSDRLWQKHEIMAQADLVVHPSGFEGNSMFVAEALSCGTPVVGYDVGFLWKISGQYDSVLDRSRRSAAATLEAVRDLMGDPSRMNRLSVAGRKIAEESLSIKKFRSDWRSFVEVVENG